MKNLAPRTESATLYPSAYDTTPARVDEFTWPEFTDALTDLCTVETPTKDRAPYWSPAVLREGTTRADANVECVGFAVIDIDALPAGVDGLVASLRASNLEAFVYESPSSTDEAPRVRVVCPTSRAMTRDEVAPVRLAFAEALGLEPGCGVEGALPASLGFYAGRVAGTRERHTWRVDGTAPVDVDALVAAPLTHAWKRGGGRKREALAHATPHAAIAPSFSDRVLELATRIEPRWLAGDRESENLEKCLYGWLLGHGWSPAEIVGLVECLDQNEPSEAKRREHARKARTAARLSGPGDAVRAWLSDDFATVDEIAGRARRTWWERREARRVRERAAEPANDSQPVATSAHRIVNVYAPIVRPNWVCEPFSLAPGAPTILSAYGGVGKSMFWQCLAVCVATGRPFLGWPVRKGRVLWFDYEQGRVITDARFQRFAAGMGLEPDALADNLEIENHPTITLTQSDAEAELVRRCEGYTLFVADSLRASSPGLDENDSRIREPIDLLYRVSEATGCLTSLLAHNRKSKEREHGGANEAMRGSSAINDAAQTVVLLDKVARGFRVSPGKVRDGQGFDAFTVELRDVPVQRAPFPGLQFAPVDTAAHAAAELDGQKAADQEAVLQWVREQPGGMLQQGGANAIVAALAGRIPRARVRDAIALLESSVPVRMVRIGSGKNTAWRAAGLK